MAYKQQPKSPMLKALKGNQPNLNAGLRAAIEAAPESPTKQAKRVNPSSLDKRTVNAARELLKKSGGINNPNLTDKEVIKAAKVKGYYAEARSGAKQGLRSGENNYNWESPTKQTTTAEFAYEKSLKDKEMGNSTKVVDKLISALEAPFSDKTYSELKKEKRAKQKAKYDAKSPAKMKKTARQLEAEKKAKMKADGKKQPLPSMKRDKLTGETPAKQTSPGSVTTRKKRASLSPKESNDEYRERTGHNKPPVGPKAEKPKTKKEVFIKKVNKKRYK